MPLRSHLGEEDRWIPSAIAVTLAYPLVAWFMPVGVARTAFGDLTIFALAAVVTWAMARNARESSAEVRAFWLLMAIGCLMWATLETCWIYFEVIARQPFPRPSWADSTFFLRLIPFLAAIALQPHSRRGSPLFRPGGLDLVILLAYWVYLYMFLVVPWQYVASDDARYFANHESLYAVARLLYVAVLAITWWMARGGWKKVYGHLLIAAALYFASSVVVSRAIDAHRFTTGSAYEVFLIASLCWYAGAAWSARRLRPEPEAAAGTQRLSAWFARLAVLAMLSLPVLALWGLLQSQVPPRVQEFRIDLTIVAMLLFGLLLFLKEHAFEGELLRLLRESRESFEHVTVLQAQLVHQEKLASLGRLVAGAAHDIDQPLNTILEESERLARDEGVPEEPRGMMEKLHGHAERTKVLIENLLSFARQSPGVKTLVDPNLVLMNAVRLREIDVGRSGIRLERELGDLPKIWADEYKLLEVCLHILNNSVDALGEVGGGDIRVRSTLRDGQVVLEFADNGPGVADPERIFEPFYTTKPLGKGAGLGLSACYGIVKEHGGEIVCRNAEPRGAVFQVRLPVPKTVEAVGVAAAE